MEYLKNKIKKIEEENIEFDLPIINKSDFKNKCKSILNASTRNAGCFSSAKLNWLHLTFLIFTKILSLLY